jgi:very-short-patch-repair endonuclease
VRVLTCEYQPADDLSVQVPRNHYPRHIRFAREMRRAQTDAERKLWSILRDRQLGGFKFRRQFPVDQFILDFYCAEGRLAVEADGGQHCDAPAQENDARRTKRLADFGIEVLRIPDDEILRFPDAVADMIYGRLNRSEGPSPQPSPRVPGEGVMRKARQ